MVPHDIQCTRQLERNSTGKILRLPHVEHERAPSPDAAGERACRIGTSRRP